MILGLGGGGEQKISEHCSPLTSIVYNHTGQRSLLRPVTCGVLTGPSISVLQDLSFCRVTVWFVT